MKNVNAGAGNDQRPLLLGLAGLSPQWPHRTKLPTHNPVKRAQVQVAVPMQVWDFDESRSLCAGRTAPVVVGAVVEAQNIAEAAC